MHAKSSASGQSNVASRAPAPAKSRPRRPQRKRAHSRDSAPRSSSGRKSGGSSRRSKWSAFEHRADRYARRVLGEKIDGGPILAGPLVRLACERHLADRRRGAWTFCPKIADFVYRFFEEVLKLPDSDDERGEPRPFKLEPAQDFILGSVFGWIGPDGYRRFREAYIEMGKGNGKTPMWAGVGLYGMIEDEEQAAEIYAAAVTRDQAAIMFRDAVRMVDRSPDLSAEIEKTGLKVVYNLSHPPSQSFFRPFSRDQGIHSGPRPLMGLIDELHEHRSAEVVNKMRAGGKFRKQPFFGEITNSGYDRTSICWQHHEHARQVLDGTVEDDRLFAYVCGLDEGDDPLEDSSCWLKANPLLGVTITDEYLKRQVQNAKNIPAETNTVLRLNFCQWTQQQSRFFDMNKWRACGAFIPDEELTGLPCYAGLDFGKSDDFTAFIMVWLLEDGRQAVRSRFWLPEAALTKYPHRPYTEWSREARLETTEGESTDWSFVEQAILKECERWSIRQVGYDDRWAERTRIYLEGEGIEMVKVQQGYGLNEALNRITSLVVEEKLCHGGDRILTWMADNMVVRHGTQGEIRPDKEKTAEKIDGIVALAMAEKCIIEDTEGENVYMGRGVLSLGEHGD